MKLLIKTFITDKLTWWLLCRWYNDPELALLFINRNIFK